MVQKQRPFHRLQKRVAKRVDQEGDVLVRQTSTKRRSRYALGIISPSYTHTYFWMASLRPFFFLLFHIAFFFLLVFGANILQCSRFRFRCKVWWAHHLVERVCGLGLEVVTFCKPRRIKKRLKKNWGQGRGRYASTKTKHNSSTPKFQNFAHQWWLNQPFWFHQNLLHNQWPRNADLGKFQFSFFFFHRSIFPAKRPLQMAQFFSSS